MSKQLGRNLLLVIMAVCAMGIVVNDSDAYEWSGSNERMEITEGLTIGGSVRLRYELKYDFKFDQTKAGNNDARKLLQTRLNAKWIHDDWFTLFVEAQDAQLLSNNAATNKRAVPSPGFAHDPLDIHQAYFEIRNADTEIFRSIKTGRQKLNFGSQRLIGALEWVNTARVWDAVSLTLGTKGERNLVAFAAQQVLVDPNNPNDWADTGARYQDSDLYGLYYTDWNLIEDVQLELYWLYRDNEDTAALGSATSGGDEVHSIGTRFETKSGNWDFDGEFVGQFGDFGGLDHSAFAAHVGAGLKVEALDNGRVGVAYNYASGDGDSTDGDHETFDNLYPTNHKFYGYMDFFAWSNMHNLEASYKTKILDDKVPVSVAFHWFWLDEEDTDSLYGAARGAIRTASAGSDVDSYVGKEIDLTAKYWVIPKRMNVLLGYSHFFSGSYLSETGTGREADFFYAQTKISF